MNDIQAIILLTGILFVIVLVKQLKLIIKEDRPNKTKGYGMPSTRAGITAFILFYILITFNLKLSTTFILFVISSIIITLKYIVRDHSALQLLAGSVLGSVLGLIGSLIN